MPEDGKREKGPKETEVYRPAVGDTVSYVDDWGGTSVVGLVILLLEHRWKLIGIPVLVVAGILVANAFAPVTYTSRAAVMPERGGGSDGRLSQLSGVASRFGIDIPTGGGEQSLQFYAALLEAPWFLEEVVTESYRLEATGGAADGATEEGPPQDPEAGGEGGRGSSAETRAGTLVELYGIQSSRRRAAISAAAARLAENLRVTVNSETGMLQFAVTTPWPEVSQQVAAHLIAKMNRFNNETRRSQASSQAQFVQERLKQAEAELRAAEDSLERFLVRNVGWEQSPELRFQQQRLQRRVDLKQEVFTSLASRYEETRIAEVQSTPVLTTVRSPRVPLGPDSNSPRLQIFLGLLVGGTVGVAWALGSEFVSRFRTENPDDYREFVSLREDATEDLRQVGRTIRRLVQRAGARD